MQMTSRSLRFLLGFFSLLGLTVAGPVLGGVGSANQAPAPRPTAGAAATAASGEAEPSWAPPKDYSEFLRDYYRIFKVNKTDCVKLGPDKVKLKPPLSGFYELVREDQQSYYIRNLPIEDKDSYQHKQWLKGQYAQVKEQVREEYMRDKYIIVDEPDVLTPFTDKLDFVRMDTGLPKAGKWQRSFDVVDMNGDGLPDLVLPPERTGTRHPWVILQQKDGSWRPWEAAKWPGQDVKLDYGAVRVSDFDGDGNLDIAIACHFLPSYVLYGNGKGDFTRTVRLPALNPDVTSQALTVADFNGDGRPDIALLSELDVGMGSGKKLKSGLVNVMLNLPGGWTAIGDDFPREIFGYHLAAADVDRDGATDLILTSRLQGIRDLVFRSLGKGEKWEPVASKAMPFTSYVYSVAVGPLDRFPNPDLVFCYQQHNPRQKDEPTQACTIYRFHDENGKPLAEPRPELLLKHKGQFDGYFAVAVGDVDGDGRNDIAVASQKGKLQVFLQFPDGRFYEQRWPGFDLGEGTMPADVRIADLNGDGMGEVIVIGAATGKKAGSGGGVWVFSPRKKAPPKAAATP